MTTLVHLGSPFVTIAAIVAAAVCAAIAWHTVHTARRQAADRVAALAAAIQDTWSGASSLREFKEELFVGELPAAPPPPLRTTPALMAFGAAAMATVLAGAVVWNARASEAPEHARQPLELARLEHGISGNAFTVSGQVAVPAGPVQGLAVELITLDQQGHALASGGAPVMLDAATRGGAPFSVSVPYSGPVDHYTIRFRDASGLRRHVDRRRVQGAAR
jgi:hypothetical protein